MASPHATACLPPPAEPVTSTVLLGRHLLDLCRAEGLPPGVSVRFMQMVKISFHLPRSQGLALSYFLSCRALRRSVELSRGGSPVYVEDLAYFERVRTALARHYHVLEQLEPTSVKTTRKEP